MNPLMATALALIGPSISAPEVGDQAASEYAGTALSDMARGIRSGFREAIDYVGDNPVLVGIVGLALIVGLQLLLGRRRRG